MKDELEYVTGILTYTSVASKEELNTKEAELAVKVAGSSDSSGDDACLDDGLLYQNSKNAESILEQLIKKEKKRWGPCVPIPFFLNDNHLSLWSGDRT